MAKNKRKEKRELAIEKKRGKIEVDTYNIKKKEIDRKNETGNIPTRG